MDIAIDTAVRSNAFVGQPQFRQSPKCLLPLTQLSCQRRRIAATAWPTTDNDKVNFCSAGPRAAYWRGLDQRLEAQIFRTDRAVDGTVIDR